MVCTRLYLEAVISSFTAAERLFFPVRFHFAGYTLGSYKCMTLFKGAERCWCEKLACTIYHCRPQICYIFKAKTGEKENIHPLTHRFRLLTYTCTGVDGSWVICLKGWLVLMKGQLYLAINQ